MLVFRRCDFMDEMAYEINGPDCGRDKNGVFHCVCGKCRPIGFLRGRMTPFRYGVEVPANSEKEASHEHV